MVHAGEKARKCLETNAAEAGIKLAGHVSRSHLGLRTLRYNDLQRDFTCLFKESLIRGKSGPTKRVKGLRVCEVRSIAASHKLAFLYHRHSQLQSQFLTESASTRTAGYRSTFRPRISSHAAIAAVMGATVGTLQRRGNITRTKVS